MLFTILLHCVYEYLHTSKHPSVCVCACVRACMRVRMCALSIFVCVCVVPTYIHMCTSGCIYTCNLLGETLQC